MPDRETFEVVLRSSRGAPWRRFQNPREIILAARPADVPAALAAVDAAVRAGCFAAGFVAYEASAAFGLPARAPGTSLPLACFGLFTQDNIEELHRLPLGGAAHVGEWKPSIDRAAYLAAISAIKARIERGDTYQINFTFRLTAPFEGEAIAVMRDLYAGQLGGWSAYIDMGDHAICSASPELFFALDGGRLTCRPMKGTAPRGLWPDEDVARGAALQQSEKNRAENVMIADMVRNDLGRIAATGTVRATSLFDVERYPMQWQMTSTIEAMTRSTSLLELFSAMFPSGSVTGTPKHSAMGIIRELESTPRGIYTGAIGCVSPRGRAHFSVAIRTIVVNRATHTAELGIGSGVVWDSVGQDEYEECLLKAGPLTGRSRNRPFVSYAVTDPPDFQLLETLLWNPDGGFVLLDRHLARLRASAECFGFECDLLQVREMLADAVGDLEGPAKLRILVEGDGAILCEAVDLTAVASPVKIALADAPIDRSDVFLYHKTTRRAVYERARAAHPDADAVVLWNEHAEVTEATDANVVISRDGQRVTPPIACGLLPGTFRAALLEQGEIVEGRITKEDLVRADQIWLINSVRGWMEATILLR